MRGYWTTVGNVDDVYSTLVNLGEDKYFAWKLITWTLLYRRTIIYGERARIIFKHKKWFISAFDQEVVISPRQAQKFAFKGKNEDIRILSMHLR